MPFFGLSVLGYAGLAASLLFAALVWWFLLRRSPSGKSGRAARWLTLGALLLLTAASFLLVTNRAGDAAPLGIPIPAAPPIFDTQVELQDTDVSKGRIPAQWLEFLAPQPDGVPPLRYDFYCDLIDFHIQHVMGTEAASFPPESVLKDEVLARALIHYGQPVSQIVYSAPLRPGHEKLNEYVSRLRHELELKGAHFYPNTETLEIKGYTLHHFEYQLDGDKGPESHYIYFGNYGLRSVTIDFITTPEQHELARPWVNKVIGSFEPGPHLLESQPMPENLPPLPTDTK